MSFLAKLYINDRVINVLSSHIFFYQEKDMTGKPVGRVNGAQFRLVVEMDSNTDFLHQMLAPDWMVEGYVRFFRRDGMSKMRDWEFWDCHIAGYKVLFSATSTAPTTLELLFSPGVLRINGVVHKKPWHVTDIDAPQAEPTPDPGMLPKSQLLECFYEAKDGTIISSPKRDQNVFLVVKTKEMKGKSITIDLSDNQVDFEYQGAILEDDILDDIKVTSDTMKLELKVIAQRN